MLYGGFLEFGYNKLSNLGKDLRSVNINHLIFERLPSNQDRQLAYISYSKDFHESSFFSSIDVKAAYQRLFEHREVYSDFAAATYNNEMTNNNGWFNFSGVSKHGANWEMLSGIELKQEFIDASYYSMDSLGNITPLVQLGFDNGQHRQISLYNIHTIDLDSWLLEIGCRINYSKLQGTTNYPIPFDITPFNLASSAKVNYRINHNNHLFSSFNTSYRTPTVDGINIGLINFGHYVSPTNNLQSEIYANIELGYRYLSQRFNSQIALFRYKTNNAIEPVAIEPINPFGTISEYQNIGEHFVQGVEMDFDFILNSNFILTGNVAYSYIKDIRNDIKRYSPPLNGSLRLTYKPSKNFTSSLIYRFANSKEFSTIPIPWNSSYTQNIPEWHTLSFSLSHQLKKLNISLGVNNIWNSNYQLYTFYTNSSITEYPISFWAGMQLQLF